MEHIQKFIRDLLLRHGFEMDESTLEVLSDTSRWEWVVCARETQSNTQMVLLGSDEIFTAIRYTSLPALSLWGKKQADLL